MWGKNRQRPIIAATSVRAGGLRGRLLPYGTGISPMRGRRAFRDGETSPGETVQPFSGKIFYSMGRERHSLPGFLFSNFQTIKYVV